MPMGKHKMWLKRCQRENNEHAEPAAPAPATAPAPVAAALQAQPAPAHSVPEAAMHAPPPHALFGSPPAIGVLPGGLPPATMGGPNPALQVSSTDAQ